MYDFVDSAQKKYLGHLNGDSTMEEIIDASIALLIHRRECQSKRNEALRNAKLKMAIEGEVK